MKEREMLGFWVQQREDAQRAVDVAERQIEILTNHLISQTVGYPPLEDYGNIILGRE